jgi:hypothetical protein
MLRNLVKKFKSQSLSESSSGDDETLQRETLQRDETDGVMSPVRKSARIQALHQFSSSSSSSQSSDDTGSPMHSANQPPAGRLKAQQQQQQQQREPTPEERDSGTESDDEELERIETSQCSPLLSECSVEPGPSPVVRRGGASTSTGTIATS